MRNKGKSLLTFVSDYILLDIETTGLSPVNDEIIEIGAIRVRNNKIVDEFSKLIKIDFPLSPFIVNLTGITDEMLKTGDEVFIVLRELIDFIGDDIIIGHNVNFDINFIYDKCKKHLDYELTNDFIDTMRISRKYVPRLTNYKLGTLAKYFNIDYSDAHRGKKDVLITYQIYNYIKEKTPTFK